MYARIQSRWIMLLWKKFWNWYDNLFSAIKIQKIVFPRIGARPLMKEKLLSDLTNGSQILV